MYKRSVYYAKPGAHISESSPDLTSLWSSSKQRQAKTCSHIGVQAEEEHGVNLSFRHDFCAGNDLQDSLVKQGNLIDFE